MKYTINLEVKDTKLRLGTDDVKVARACMLLAKENGGACKVTEEVPKQTKEVTFRNL